MTGEITNCDVLIVGGGLVGSALANALRQVPVETVLIESHRTDRLEQPSFDGRVTALANGSQRILHALGIWREIEGSVEPISTIHISERGQFGLTRIRAEEEGVPALGFTIENRLLGQALWAALRAAPRFQYLSPAELSQFDVQDDAVSALIETDSQRIAVRSKLMIAADGSQSSIRASLGIGVRQDEYGQAAVIFNCLLSRPLCGLALERFVDSLPVAVLPMSESRAAIVWTLKEDAAAEFAAQPDAKIAAALERAVGQRIGRVLRVGARSTHALARVRSRAVVGKRTVLLGNAAVSLHPVAGQGFNLALRDLAVLAELIADAARDGADVGSVELLDDYARLRHQDQRAVAGFTHGLIRLFGSRMPGAGVLRGVGLTAFDLIPGAKAALARHTMGRAGRLSRLARGIPLNSP